MKLIWVDFVITEKWSKPQGWQRFGWTWNYISWFNKKLLIIHGWGTIETAQLWLENE